MAIEDIKKELQDKFNQPLQEYYKRRIIFWYDENQEFINDINELVLENAKILILQENQQFYAKKLLNLDDPDSNYLVYLSFRVDQEHDWLLDLKLYNESYRADFVSRIMQEMNIDNTADLMNTVKEYKQFFNKASNRKDIVKVNDHIQNRNSLCMAILAVITKSKKCDSEFIIRNTLKAGIDVENSVKFDLLKYSALPLFWSLVRNTCDYKVNDNSNLDSLKNHIILTALSHTLDDKVLEGLQGQYSHETTYCYQLVSNWINTDIEQYNKAASDVVDNLQLVNRFNQFTIDDLMDTHVLSCIEEIILNKLMQEIINNTINDNDIIHIIETRQSSPYFDDYKDYYNALKNYALMLQFKKDNHDAFHYVNSKELWNNYTNKYYLMDTYYRYFYLAFNNAKLNNNDLIDNLKSISEKVESLYKDWYLDKLNSNFTSCIKEDLSSKGYISGIRQQVDFYHNYVRDKNTKSFVIISDALRYEVAASLVTQLKIDTNADIILDSQQAIFPSVTKFGMAALLPHKTLSIDASKSLVEVLVDGKPSGSGYRDGILKAYNENSIELKYSDIIDLKKNERRELVKDKQVVYIYHDTIDNASHSKSSETFEACEKAIKELSSLIRAIKGDLSVMNIIVTADHGFLYTYKPLNEVDKVNRKNFKEHIVEQDRRYVLTDDKAEVDELIPVKGFYNDENLLAFTPYENMRLKGSGDLNFVHGGISLQELVVPVLDFKGLRIDSKAYRMKKNNYDTTPVSLSFLSSSHKISNLIFNLSFFQKEPVSNTNIACTYNVYVTDSNNNIVSDIVKIVADKTSDNNKDREYKVTMNLKSMKYDATQTYYLVIIDEDHKQVPVKESLSIDIAMAIDEFNFFG